MNQQSPSLEKVVEKVLKGEKVWDNQQLLPHSDRELAANTIEGYLSYQGENEVYLEKTELRHQISNLKSSGSEEVLKKLLLRNPYLFSEFFDGVCHARYDLARWCIDNKDKWIVREGRVNGPNGVHSSYFNANSVDEVIYCCIVYSFLAKDISMYLDDIKKLVLSPSIRSRGDGLACRASDNSLFDLLYPTMTPDWTHLENIIRSVPINQEEYKGGYSLDLSSRPLVGRAAATRNGYTPLAAGSVYVEMLARSQYKFDKILQHPELNLSVDFYNFWPHLVLIFIKSNLLSEPNLSKLLAYSKTIKDSDSYVFFSKECIEWINTHPELEWIKKHPLYSEKVYEKASAKDLVKIAMEKTWDDDVKKILQVAMKMLENPDGEIVITDDPELEAMMWKYHH